MTAPLSELVDKLIAFNIIEKRANLLHFTPTFCRHVLRRQAKSKSNSVESWREIISSFSGSALELSDQEVTEVIVFLDYYLERKASNDGDEIEV